MEWLLRIAAICAALSAIIGFFVLVRSKVIRPLIGGYDELLKLLAQIRDASSGVQKLAREVEGLAGAVANFVVGIKAQVDRNTDRIERLEDMREMVVDHEAAIRHLQRIHPDNKHKGAQ